VDSCECRVGEVHFGGMEGFEVDVIWVEDTTFTADAVVGEDEVVVLNGGFAEDFCADVLLVSVPVSRGVYFFHFETPGCIFLCQENESCVEKGVY